MRVSDLYDGPFKGQTVYIVGTGPSMKVFPIDFLKDQCCILLNDASRVFPLGPAAFTNHRQWIEPITNPLVRYPIVKARMKSDPHPERDDNHVPWDHPSYYCFSYRDHPWDDVSHFDRARLWAEPCHYWNTPGGTVAVFAVQFALRAGARAIVLAGCDCLALRGDDYVDPALAQVKHRSKRHPHHNYEAYAEGLMVLKREAERKFGVPLLTLTPFCGLGREQQQYIELLADRAGGEGLEEQTMTDVIRVSIGTEPMQRIPAEVLMSSIRRRTSRAVEFTLSWTPDGGWHPLLQQLKKTIRQPEVFGGTQFNLWRWLVPECYRHQGKAIYLDADQVVQADIGQLWDALQPGASFGAVFHAVGFFGEHKKPEPGACQTSVMVMDCARCSWDAREICRQCQEGILPQYHGPKARSPYATLMQARWWQGKTQELDPAWNHFGIHESGTRLIHWSHVSSQPYRNPQHETAPIFLEELRAAVEAEHITLELVDQEIGLGHLHAVYGQALRDPQATLARLLALYAEQPEARLQEYERELEAVRAELEAAKASMAKVKKKLGQALRLQDTWTWRIGSAVTRPVRLVRRLARGRR